MPSFRRARIGLVLLTAAALAAPLAGASPAAAATRSDRTSSAEAKRVDRVRTPKLGWFDCSSVFQTPTARCATADLPLDYDKPKGATTEVALLKIPAAVPSKRIGTLFINPGGPGGSGVQLALAAPFLFSQAVLDRFDVVGFDPRGIGYSEPVRCWPNAGAQAADLAPFLTTPFPVTGNQTRAAVTAAKAWGRACSTTGTPLSASMSTANVARDLDVLRRAVGDTKLTYLGFSYGTYLGQVYANLFPDRVRAVVLDGVVDPTGWVGNDGTRNVPIFARIGSDVASAQAMKAVLARCKAAGKDFCMMAGLGDPTKVWTSLLARAKRKPIVISDPTDPSLSITLTYAQIYSIVTSLLYDQVGAGELVDLVLTMVASGSLPTATPAARKAAVRTVLSTRALIRAQEARLKATPAGLKAFRGAGFPYDNEPDAYSSVLCTDGHNGRDAARWPGYVAKRTKLAQGFAQVWGWSSVQCASPTWSARDEDRYRGPFTRRTAAPVLVVGNTWDPATTYRNAVKVAGLLPSSRLLLSRSWGHTAYGTSACATGAVDAYLVAGRLPRKGTVCTGDAQPFTVPLADQLPPDAGLGATAALVRPGGAARAVPATASRRPVIRLGLPVVG